MKKNIKPKSIVVIAFTLFLVTFVNGAAENPSLNVELSGGIRGLAISFTLRLPPTPNPRTAHIRVLLDGFSFWRSEQIPGTQRPITAMTGYAQTSHGFLWQGYSWVKVRLSRQGIWQEQIMLQRPVTPGIHRVTLELYLTNKSLPAECKARGLIPEGWHPVLATSDKLVVKDVTVPDKPGQVLISSVPFGGRVYVRRKIAQDGKGSSLYGQRFFKGVTPLTFSLQPGDYLVGVELQGTSNDLLWEDDGCLSWDVDEDPITGIWYRRTYTLHVDLDAPEILIALFQVRDSFIHDLLYVLPKIEAFPITNLTTLHTRLSSYGIPEQDIKILTQAIKRGGKAVWKECYGPLPWLFTDRYRVITISYCVDNSVTIEPEISSNPAPKISAVLSTDSSNVKLLVNLLLLPEMQVPTLTASIGRVGPIYHAFTNWPAMIFYHKNGTPMSESEKLEFYEKILSSLLEAKDKGKWLEIARSYREYLSGDFLRFVLLKAESMAEGNSNFRDRDALPLNSLALELGKLLLPDKDFLGVVYLQRGRIFVCSAEPDREKALDSFRTALAYFERFPINQVGVFLSATELGNLFTEWYHDYLGARAYYVKALEASKRAAWGLSIAMSNLAQTYLFTGEYERALQLAQEAEKLDKGMGRDVLLFSSFVLGKWSVASRVLEGALSSPSVREASLWSLSTQTRLIETAIRWYVHLDAYRKAIRWASKLARCNKAEGLLTLGELLLQYGNYGRALQCFETVGKIKKLLPPDDPASVNALIYAAHIYALTGNRSFYKVAEKLLQTFLVQFSDVTAYKAVFAKVHRNLAFSSYVLGFYKDGYDHINIAISLDTERGSNDDLWRDYSLLGLLSEKIGRYGGAKEAYQNAIHLIEGLRATIGGDVAKRLFLYLRRLPYERYIALLVKNRAPALDMIMTSERCHSRAFLDLLAKGPVGTIANIAEAGIKTGVIDPEAISEDVQEVIASLPADTATLEYFVTDDATYVWVIRDGKVNGPITVKHSRQELMNKIIEARKWLEEGKEVVNRDLAELYDWLIRPVEDFLPKTTGEGKVPHLIIIPSGPLYYLPFQALIWTSQDYSENAPLIARYALSYSPSVATLKYAQQREQTAYPRSTFLGLADPVPSNPDIPRLPEARVEAKTVAHLFAVSKVYVDKQATEDVVQSHSATAREVLLSTHGFFNPHSPMSSYLLTTRTPKNSDGKLYAYEVFRLPLHADMVVLSACETLLPAIEDMKGQIKAVRGAKEQDKPVQLTEDQLKELTAGDEVVGLTRAFLSAGAASVLSSLWSVSSDSTEKLMVSFYKHVQEGIDKAEALRAAEIEVMNTSGYTQPWYWAAFNLVGNWR